MKKGILFDLDGTIINSSLDLASAINAMRAHFGYAPLPVDLVTSFIGNGTAVLVTKSIADTTIVFEEAMKVNREKYSSALSVHTTFYEGALELLQYLYQKGVPVAITSNKPTDWCKTIATDLGFSQYVSVIFGASPDYALKPAADMLLLAAAEMQIDLAGSFMIGDNWTDIDSGKLAGCQTAYFEHGLGNLKENQPDFKYRNIRDLKRWLIAKLAL